MDFDGVTNVKIKKPKIVNRKIAIIAGPCTLAFFIIPSMPIKTGNK
jgi:hypothetical protein